MTDIRQDQLCSFVKSITLLDKVVLISLNGDASFRRYFRVEGQPFIAVDAPPQTQKNQEFVTIDIALEKLGIKVPKIISYDLNNGFMLLEDLGNTTFANVAVGIEQETYYRKAITLLPSIAKVGCKLPLFDDKFIKFELNIFNEWMLDKALNVKLTDDEQQCLNDTYQILADGITSQEQVAMHRDYHSRNLMVCGNDLAVIDFQDMVKGLITYDLASILFDCYVNLDDKLIENLTFDAYRLYQKQVFLEQVDFEKFKYDLRLTSLQRHIKVLGIFCRLHLRDGKDAYLKDLPRVIDYVVRECQIDERFAGLSKIIQKYVVGKF